MNPLFGFEIGPVPLLMLLALGVLLFGRRLPEVGRYLGKGITEFKKGLKGLEDDFDTNTVARQPETPPAALDQPRPPQRVSTSVPKFEDNANPATPPKTS